MRGKLVLVAVVIASLVGVAACGSGGGSPQPSASSSGSSPQGSAKTVKTATVKGLGTVLVNTKGYVLYMFPPDKRTHVTCTGPCAGSWPPATVPTGTTPKAQGKVQQNLLGTVPNPNPAGGQVVTYHGWPLYTYAADPYPGRASGQALDVNGGYWYVMRPSGQIVKAPPKTGNP